MRTMNKQSKHLRGESSNARFSFWNKFDSSFAFFYFVDPPINMQSGFDSWISDESSEHSGQGNILDYTKDGLSFQMSKVVLFLQFFQLSSNPRKCGYALADGAAFGHRLTRSSTVPLPWTSSALTSATRHDLIRKNKSAPHNHISVISNSMKSNISILFVLCVRSHHNSACAAGRTLCRRKRRPNRPCRCWR